MNVGMKQSKVSYNAGVTIIELVVVLFILGLLSAGVIAFQRNIFSTSRVLQTSLRSESQTHSVFRAFTAEVRSALPAWNGASIIESAATSTLIFYTTIDADKYTERVRYQLVGTQLVKGITKFNIATGAYDLPETTTTIVSGINAAPFGKIFSYYDKNYDGSSSSTPLAAPVDIARVRLVRFDLPLAALGTTASSTRVNSIQVTFRNLKDNY
ncbi:MAG TPA: prepilin-type N-terminal cleavage/methylation domain-containing protein [Candidatus Paceibacterota bacterium]|nr:prepilin-type N-terminal cleavage/methylation domain-containing protein [Candidatus Paceibacterota bacterium]